ncbi:hypothetical protein J7E97_08035 [Streptomyces sp. ISL-66]|uniref:hypothetical protein n=1 Tax=Streptomyces sp. ISL-66 TaxID=2819186 RepID=UPI001BEBDA8F|nr:hypothetical protein [Streptomyces sp. ISL-66]MBT2467822.1 hypothetical protein [Streptomyces sp. ISL-66]
MSKIRISWEKPGDRKSMARQIARARKQALRLTDDGGGLSSPEALVAEEMADQMAHEFQRTFGETYYRYA